MPPGPRWLTVLAEAWEAGAAVLPIDNRLSPGEIDRLLAIARPTAVLHGDGQGDGDGDRVGRGDVERVRGGTPAAPGVRLVMATSGTAAEPKLVELTHDALTSALNASASRLGATSADPWLCVLPVSHMGGMLVVHRAVVQGAPVTVRPSFDVGEFARAAAAGARFASVVPTMLRRLLDANVDLRGFASILVGGAGMEPSLRARAAEAGANVVATYGLTEACGGVVYDGRPLDGVWVRVDQADGQVFLGGETLMRGYRLDAAATRDAFDLDGWLRTRDAGSWEEGRLTIHGRFDAAIVTGGEKVWPEQVEAVLRTHPGVADVLVGGRPDPEWGERVVAFVVAADPAAPPSLGELREHAADQLARHALPKEVELVGELPRTPSGKLVRRSERDDRQGR